MSVGFNIGDFVAIQQLAECLYKEIPAQYEAQEPFALQNELTTLN
jgi:hypothetical protein